MTTAPPDDPKAQLPEWIPSSVIHIAGHIHATRIENARDAELLGRLVCDPLMKKVWRELYRKDNALRPTDRYVHPAQSVPKWLRSRAAELRRAGNAKDEEEAQMLERQPEVLERGPGARGLYRGWTEQDFAVMQFCATAFDLAQQGVEVTTKTEHDAQLGGFLREIDHAVDPLDACLPDDEECEMQEILSVYEEQRYFMLMPDEDEDDDDPLIVERDRGDRKLRGFVRSLAAAVHDLFGNQLYGTVANVANVVFPGAGIKGSQVREMLRKR